MENQLIVAVWMVTYNHGEFIENAIESVMMQKSTFKYKLFIGEDCSTDKTREICKKLKEKYTDKIDLILHKKNIGSYSNGIFMYKHCFNSGAKYIALCDGDDYWTDPYKLQKQVELLEQFPEASMCVALNEQLYPDKHIISDKKIESKNSPLIYFDDLNQYFHTSTYLIKKSSMDVVIDKYCHLLYGDTSMRFLLISQGPFVLLNEYVSVYRITNIGAWTKLEEIEKDLQHYHMYHNFRLYFTKEQKAFHLKNELRYLTKLISAYHQKKEFLNKYKLLLSYYCLLIKHEPRTIKLILKNKLLPNK